MATLDDNLTKSNDPKLVSARLFIGNLPSERITKEELIKIFDESGKVIGVSINKGFGFIQYETEAEAAQAVKDHHKILLKGNKLDVKLSGPSKKNHPDGGQGSRKRHYDDEPQRIRGDRRRDIEPPTNYNLPRLMQDRGPLPHGAGPFLPMGPPSMNDHMLMLNHMPPPNIPPNFVAQGHPPGGLPFRIRANFLRDERFVAPGAPPPSSMSNSAPPPAEDSASLSKKVEKGVERPFDAVIVVTHKSLKHYAEMVERRLLELNMVVDMIFLLNEKALNKAIDDMTCRGVLYIIVVQVQHEEHKSITINIMHGSPQEHRNMPLEDALIMLARNFNSYLSSLRCGSEQPTMGFLLNLLADGKHLSVAELDRIISHLQDRRDRLIEAEGGQKEMTSSSVNSTVALQQKILSLVSSALLNNSTPSAMSQQAKSGAVAQPPPAAALANLAQQFGLNWNNRGGGPSNGPMGPHGTAGQQATMGLPPQQTGPMNPNQGPSGTLAPLNMLDPNLMKAIDNLMQNPSIFKSLNQSQGIATSAGPSFAVPPPDAANILNYGRK